MNEYFLAYAASQPLREYWERARRELASYDIDVLGHAEAHSTVMRPRALDPDAATMMRARISAAVKRLQVHPVYVQVGEIEMFPTRLQQPDAVFYLPLLGEGVQKEYVRLIMALGRTPEGFEGKTPHLTVARVPIAQLTVADRVLRNVARPLEYDRLDSLVWYERRAGMGWEPIERFALDPVTQPA